MSVVKVNPLRARALIASIVAVVGAVSFRIAMSTNEATIYIPVVAIIIGALVIHLRPLGAQLLGRALFWSNFILGTLLCLIGSGSERWSGFGLLFGCGFALVLVERRALTEAADDRGFRPAAFAGTIELLMVLALADAQTCLLLGVIGKADGYWGFFVGALALVIGFVGLYRLALWGVVVTMSTATLLALSMFAGVFRLNDAQVPLGIVFAAQVLAPLPMLWSLVTKQQLPRPNPRFRSAVVSIFIVFVMIVSAVVAVSHVRHYYYE
jgi:hypothetical protein